MGNLKFFTTTLSQDAVVDIFSELKSGVAESPTIRFYPMIKYEIGVTSAVTTPAVTAPKEHGFEAVFAIAGLLAVAFLVLKQRK